MGTFTTSSSLRSATGSPGMPPTSTGGFRSILNSAVPGLPGMQNRSSQYINSLMSGVLSPETSNAINQAAATQAVAGGMPGSNRIGGTLMGNRTLRDIGLTSLGQQQQGFDNFLKLLGTQGNLASTESSQRQQASQFAADLDFRNRQAAVQESLDRARLALEERRFQTSLPSDPPKVPVATKYRIAGENYAGVPGAYNLPILYKT